MYVVPFSMGPLGSPIAHIGVQLTDSRLRGGEHADHDPHGPGRPRRARRDGEFVPCLHSVGMPARRRARPTCRGPATPRTSTSSTSPRPARSGPTARATAATPCSARSASPCASPRPWPATTAGWPSTCSSSASPRPRARRSTSPPPSRRPAARPTWRCSSRRLPGWKVETIGDDIAWMKFGDDGRLYAINPEAGFFGVAPGTSDDDQPQRPAPRCDGNSIFTNCALTDDGDIWWEDLSDPPAHLIDWKGQDWTPESGTPAAHPNARFTAPAVAVPVDRPRVGGPRRRADLGHPLRRPPRHQRPAGDRVVRLAARRVPRLDHVARRRPPPPPAPSASCASTPSPCCPSAATTWATTSATGSRSARPPTPTSCPSSSGSTGSARATTARSCGPASATTAGCSSGSSSASRATADAVDTAIGRVPDRRRHRHRPASTSTPPPWPRCSSVDNEAWRAEIPQIEAHFDAIGERLPAELRDELDELEKRLAD